LPEQFSCLLFPFLFPYAVKGCAERQVFQPIHLLIEVALVGYDAHDRLGLLDLCGAIEPGDPGRT